MKDKTALCKDSANREQNKINLFIFYAYLQRTDDNIKITADNLQRLSAVLILALISNYDTTKYHQS